PATPGAGAWSPPIASRAIRMGYFFFSFVSSSGATATRPWKYPQFGQTRCGSTGSLHCRQYWICIGRTAWCDRRWPCLEWDVRLFGTAMSACRLRFFSRKQLGYAHPLKRTGAGGNLVALRKQRTKDRRQKGLVTLLSSLFTPLVHLKFFKNSSNSFLCFSTVLAGPTRVG